uniref:Hepatitis A virus cellular receptor 2 n=1 Tax=Marmota marmota marmota TaxID=9994 RepID=A0A8C5ZH20_MARMA
ASFNVTEDLAASVQTSLVVRHPQVWSVEVGQDASLPCSYNPISSKSLVPVCWGKESCPVFGCKDLVLSTDETNVKDQKSSRYQLKGNLHKGDVSLTIVNVTPADSGTYCCRIQFRGPVNDYKLNVELIIKPGEWNLCMPSLSTTRRGLYIGVGISAGLALTLIFKCLNQPQHFSFHSLITLANPRPSGLANAAADRMRSEENIYIIEENIYEMEDPNEDYCYISSEQQY